MTWPPPQGRFPTKRKRNVKVKSEKKAITPLNRRLSLRPLPVPRPPLLLLQVNSNPSTSIDHDPSAAAEEGAAAEESVAAGEHEVSPVDLLIKRRVLTDALRLTAELSRLMKR